MLDNFKVETLSSYFYNEKKIFSFELALFDLNNRLISKIFVDLKKSSSFLTLNDFRIKNIYLITNDGINKNIIYKFIRLYFIDCIKSINLILFKTISYIKEIKKDIFLKKLFDFDIDKIKKNIFKECGKHEKCISFYCFKFFSDFSDFFILNKLKRESLHLCCLYKNIPNIFFIKESVSNFHWVAQRKVIRIKYSDDYVSSFESYIHIYSDIYIIDSVKEEKTLEIKQSYCIKFYYDKNILFLFKNEINILKESFYQKLKNISYELSSVNKKMFLINFADSENINVESKYICILKTQSNSFIFDNKEFLSGNFNQIDTMICAKINLTKEKEENQDATTFKYSA